MLKFALVFSYRNNIFLALMSHLILVFYETKAKLK